MRRAILDITTSPLLFVTGVIVALSIIVPLFLWLAFKLFRNRAAEEAVVALVTTCPEAIAFLGAPVKICGYVWGRSGDGHMLGTAWCHIWGPISGPKGRTQFNVKLEKVMGPWRAYQGYLDTGYGKISLIDRKPIIGNFGK